MTVKQLIKALKTLPQEADVLVSSDEEGNSFSALFEVSHDSMEKVGRFYEPTDQGPPNTVILWPA